MMVSVGNFFFRYRNGLFPLALLMVLLPGKPLFANPLVALSWGALIAILGQSVRIGTIGYEYIIRGGRNRRVYAENLVTEGIYGLCRNPMYVGNLLILLGVAVVANSTTCLAVAVPLFTFVYIAIVAAEEDFLRGRFGEAYDRYAAEVPRWLPRIGAIGDVLGNGRFHWRRVLVKEFGTPFGWLTMMLLLVLFNLWRSGQIHSHGGAVQELLAAYVVLAMLYSWIRQLKRSRRIVAN